MKLKFNWGTGIVIFLILFFVAIFWFVFFTFGLRQDLVEEDYYPKELGYEEQIQKQKNLTELGEEVSYEFNNSNLILTFPKNQVEEKIQGQIHIYRPSDSRLDKIFKIEANTLNKQLIPTSNFPTGKYVMKIGWTYQNKAFYQEISIIL